MNISIPTMSFKSITIPKFNLPKVSMPKLVMPAFFSKKAEALYTKACKDEADAHYAIETEARITRLEKQLKQMQALVFSQEIMNAPK